MNNIHTLICSKKKYLFNGLQIDVEIEANPYQLELSQLFIMAGRINKKRSFLFVSKLIGKHIPINPKLGIVTGSILAERFLVDVKGVNLKLVEMLRESFLNNGESFEQQPFVPEQYDPVIIGFAETATGLGHAFYESFLKADFFHTTREELLAVPSVFTFEEEHSHATSHRCYVNENLLNNDREIILVDDELTTGNTAINIIRSIQSEYPRKTYTVISILDWRSLEHQKAFLALEVELGISINCVSLLKGNLKISGELQLENTIKPESIQSLMDNKVTYIPLEKPFPSRFTTIPVNLDSENQHSYLYETGRFGLNSQNNQQINEWLEDIASYLKETRSGKSTLCLGTGEFMYLPMKLATFLGDGVSYHSTTRSPIHPKNDPEYGVNWKLEFPNPENLSVINYVYNIQPNLYDDVFVFLEREVPKESLLPLLAQLNETGIRDIKIVFFSGKGESL